MAKINMKSLKDKVVKMLSAWLEGAADVVFKGITRQNLEDKYKQAERLEGEIDDLRATLKLKEELLDSLYLDMNNMTVDVRSGVAGDTAFGDDSALYGAMGFIRKSERKSGLTRKKKPISE